MLNVIRREAERAMNRQALPHMGRVTSYDPDRYACKVELQPSDAETGWLPIAALWTGNGWGLLCPPTPGDVVDVHFQEGGKEAGFVSLRFFSAVTRPPRVESGELLMQHKTGSHLRFLNDGSVEIVADAINSTAPVWFHTGDLLVSGEIRDVNAGFGSLNELRTAYNNHVHVDSMPGPGTTGLTNLPVA